MAALLVLTAATAALLALAAAPRAMQHLVPPLQAAFCLIGLAAALLARSPAGLEAGPTLAIDGLSAALLAALLLLGASGAAPRRPALLATLAATLLAADALTLLAALAAAMLVARAGRRATIPLAALALALLILFWPALPNVRFAAIRAMPLDGLRAGLLLPAALAAAATLPLALPAIPGALAALYVLARFLLDLPGPTTPGWWGVPTLALGTLSALALARRTGAADDLLAAAEAAGAAILALAAAAIGVALLARGADLLPLAATASAAALLLVLTWSVWGSLLFLACNAIAATVGATTLSRLGGLLRRTPAIGLALLTALASTAALPLSAGFAAVWLLLQAVLAGGRAGGTVVLALAAAAAAAIGATLALLAAAAFRLAAAALLGRPRGTRAAAAVEPSRTIRLGMAGLAVATLVIGIFPGLLFTLLQPAILLLNGTEAEGAGVWSLATTTDASGYAAPALTLLLAATIAVAAWAGRSATHATSQPWQGGLAAPGTAAITPKLVPWPGARNAWRSAHRRWCPAALPRLAFNLLALALAAALGWAAR